MNMKKTILFILIIAIVALFSYTAINGIEIGKFKITSVKDSIDLGLDLAGGVCVILEAKTDLQGTELQKSMEQSKMIISERVDSLGVAEPNITIEGKKRIRIELAGIENPQEAIELIGKTAQLQFVDPDGKEILTGKNVKGSEVVFHKTELGEKPVVSLEFDKEGAEKFKEATKRLSQKETIEEKIIYIVLDDQVISAPVVKDVITDGKAVIEGEFDVEEANKLATLIRAGALPVEMSELQTSIIGPTLGLEALDRSVKAGAIAILIIFLFMLIYYRIPGLVADIGLTIYVLILVYAMKFLGVKLTLPGIAGLILSIGMAVDANVLIFERIKEELKNGKTIRVSIDHGFNRALSSVLDSNITTLIAGIVLYYFGIGPIKGFGITLILGIIASMITSVFVTKHLLMLTVDMTNTKNAKLYGM
ncbi:preprotein translocase subunit SecD [Keratinibaculum paraultunense]|uniref:Protein translocase subunit SecD n=1 Tax=Keratinibaculum paraultunense TaxID=1278232 RepID=A0A4R3KW47_9FIRM|nr:protein translocase subunit SecD [Keratinibaculum paraultunense]TCS89560.1 preprotein translocase subunit SecD [Keratinibaculum paraultunense]